MAALLIVLLILGAWQLVVEAGAVDSLILPAPTEVARSLWEDRGLLAPDLAVTGQEVLIGLAAAVALGVLLGVGMHVSPVVRRALRPLVIGSQAVPVPVIAPLLILVLGFGLAPKILLVALVCFFPVAINLYDGLGRVDHRRAQAHALVRRLALADVPPARGARRAARGVHRAEGRGRRVGHRRRVRGVGGL